MPKKKGRKKPKGSSNNENNANNSTTATTASRNSGSGDGQFVSVIPPRSSDDPVLLHVNMGPDKPPMEPGREVKVLGLKNRTDLNGMEGLIVRGLDTTTGRVGVRLKRLAGTEHESTETVAIKADNLEVLWNIPPGPEKCGEKVEVCPLCMDTPMNTLVGEHQNASVYACCGAKVCHRCFIKTQQSNDPDRCPLCRADTSDTSDRAAVEHLRKRASRGDADAQYTLASSYDSGLLGLHIDQKEARKLYELAAVQKHPRAAYNLGVCHRDGDGGRINYKEAARWFRVAAELDHVQAMTNLGLLYFGDMRGVGEDYNEAQVWLTKAAHAGDELAVRELQKLKLMIHTRKLGFGVALR